MRRIQIALILIAIGLLCLGPGLGLSSSSIWYSMQEPNDAGKLQDVGPSSVQPQNNSLWIVNFAGDNSSKKLDIPAGGWARLRLMPSVSGELNIYIQYPTGSIDLLLSGTAEKGHSYMAWCQADLEGDYQIWYNVDGAKSNSVQLKARSDMAESQLTGVNATAAMPSSYGGGILASAPAPAAPAAMSKSIGLSAGGAKDINSFRDNIKNDYLPLPTDITYEGLFYDYYFDTGQSQECKKLFCPSYSYAISKDPFSKEPQYYLSVGLNSGITDFKRKKLNLVVVLDYSGSMGSPFDQYYYDRFGNQVEQKSSEDSGKKKIEIADKSVVALLNHLKAGDRFGLVIFSDSAYVVDPLTSIEDKDLQRLKAGILNIAEDGSTNLEAGMKKATRLFGRYLDADPSEYENRIIFLTDGMTNVGETGLDELFSILKENAAKKIYTTFIGVGVDFNTELVNSITKVQGANYYSVHSSQEFKERMDDEFDYMVTPLVFDLKLKLLAQGYEIETVYGSPEADLATGEIMKVNTLFPSKVESGQVKGGVILVKLKKLSQESSLALEVSYKDRNGASDSNQAQIDLAKKEPDFFQNSGIRKAVLLSRYADLLKDWTIDERKALMRGEKFVLVPMVTKESGIVLPVMLGEWERQSVPLQVSEPYRKLFGVFGSYFLGERSAIGDDTLQQEEVILDKLSKYEGSRKKDSGSDNGSPGFWQWLISR